MKSFLINSLLLFLIFSCSDNDFKKYSKLDRFRVLAIKADKTEVADTGETVTLSFLVSDSAGGGRSMTVNVEGCLDPGIAYGAQIDCENSSSYINPTYNSGNAIDLSSDLTPSNSFYTGAVNTTLAVTLDSSLISDRSIIEQFNGVYFIFIFTFTAGNETVRAFKRIKISSNPSKNSNPSISSNSITFSGSSPSLTTSEVTLDLTISSGAETYSYFSLDFESLTATETIAISWFASNGTISNSQVDYGESSTFKSDNPLPSSMVIVGVIRDGRGGVDYIVKFIN